MQLIIEAFVNSEDVLCNLKSRKHDMEEKRQALWIEIEKQKQLRKIAQDRMQDFRERWTKIALLCRDSKAKMPNYY